MAQKIISRYGGAYWVKDESLFDMYADFYKWLRDEGFEYAWHKGHYSSCNWCFINIKEKLFAYGMPGIEIAKPIGGTAISIDEFMEIYNENKQEEQES